MIVARHPHVVVPGTVVLARSLSEDPMLAWMFPERDELRLSRIALFFSGQVERLVRHGLVHRAPCTDGATVMSRRVRTVGATA